MKLWQKEKTSDNFIHDFTVGKDRDFDLRLAKYDVTGSIAHARMLASVGLITNEECDQLVNELHAIQLLIESGTFEISTDAEDVHSQIEFILTERLGETGKKIHTARSRNDQSLLNIKLYLRDEIAAISGSSKQLALTLLDLAEKHEQDLLPGFTHFQLAMPSSFGLWFSAYAESLADDLELMNAAYRIADQNPLGSAAGFGSSFPIDREFTTRELNFSGMNVSSVYAQMTRGKTEKTMAFALSGIAATLGKLAGDITLFMNQEFAYISFPEEFTTGSSIMPHKRNPDAWELIRAKCNRIQSIPNEFTILLANLPSGYHRDLQLTKEILFPAIDSMKEIIAVANTVIQKIEVRKNILADAKYDSMFTVDAVNELVQKGISFREAYKIVGNQIHAGAFKRPAGIEHTHLGSTGNPALRRIRSLRFSETQNPYNNTITKT